MASRRPAKRIRYCTPPPRRGSSKRRCDRCDQHGRHLCRPRYEHVLAVFDELLVHTKGRYARAPFRLAAWQRDEIVVPVFGWVEWSKDAGGWVRVYRTVWIELARKNGKSELLAAFALILLSCDDEEGAEIYGAAKDRDQARKVFDVAARMVELSPTLAGRLRVLRQAKRIVYERTGSYYEAIAADASGNLGHNPHGIIFDEVLTQPNGDLWDALETGMGTRDQPLMVAATTPGNDQVSFAAQEHKECLAVLEDPRRDPQRYVYLRNTPRDADWTDEANWYHANPALGDFLSIDVLRSEFRRARRSLRRQNSFRQFRLSQWVQQLNRWLDLGVWDANGAGLIDEQRLAGRDCYAGLDLANTTDITAVSYVFPPPPPVEGELPAPTEILWRFFIPEDAVAALDARTSGLASQWAKEGFLTVTDGNVLDYPAVRAQIDRDAAAFRIRDLGYDPWSATQFAQQLQDEGGLQITPVRQGYATMSEPTKELERRLLAKGFNHGGHPVARWMADNVTIRTDPAGNVKPDKERSGDKIDGLVATIIGLDRLMRAPKPKRSAYTDRGLLVA